MSRLSRRTLLSTFGVAYMAPLITGSARSTQASAAGTRRVALVPPGGNRFRTRLRGCTLALIVRPPPRTQPEASQRLNSPYPRASAQGFTSITAKMSGTDVVEGTFLFDAGDERHELRTGASIFLPRDISHRWANSSTSGQGRLLLVNQPGGFEKFFDELGKLPRNMTDADMKVMDELAGRFGMEMLGPPIFT